MKIVIRQVDDWIAVYKDGEKQYENHSCSIRDGLRALDIPFDHEDGHALSETEQWDFFPETLER